MVVEICMMVVEMGWMVVVEMGWMVVEMGWMAVEIGWMIVEMSWVVVEMGWMVVQICLSILTITSVICIINAPIFPINQSTLFKVFEYSDKIHGNARFLLFGDYDTMYMIMVMDGINRMFVWLDDSHGAVDDAADDDHDSDNCDDPDILSSINSIHQTQFFKQ